MDDLLGDWPSIKRRTPTLDNFADVCLFSGQKLGLPRVEEILYSPRQAWEVYTSYPMEWAFEISLLPERNHYWPLSGQNLPTLNVGETTHRIVNSVKHHLSVEITDTVLVKNNDDYAQLDNKCSLYDNKTRNLAAAAAAINVIRTECTQ